MLVKTLKRLIGRLGVLFLLALFLSPVSALAEERRLHWEGTSGGYDIPVLIGGLYYVKMSSNEVGLTNNEEHPDKTYIGKVTIPEKVSYRGNEYSVTSILYGAFMHSEATFVYVPNSVKIIENYAFYGSKKLTAITLPTSIKSIEDNAFANCKALKNIKLPDGLVKIEDELFEYCESLTSIDIPESVKSIGAGAFASCTNLRTVNIPQSVTIIGRLAFYGCDNLKCVKVPSHTKIEERAFPETTQVIRE